MAEPNDPLPRLDYAPPSNEGIGAARLLKRVVVTAVGVLICLLLLAVFLPYSDRAREPANRVMCASNMRQIGVEIAAYANEHGGIFPPDMNAFFESGDLTTSVFVCPSSNDTPAPTAPTTQATVAGILQPGHLSYVYLGKGMNNQTVTDDTVLLYEPLSNHAGKGMNVMFGDFHVEWLTAAEAATILKQVAGRKSPVRYPLTQPSAKQTVG